MYVLLTTALYEQQKVGSQQSKDIATFSVKFCNKFLFYSIFLFLYVRAFKIFQKKNRLVDAKVNLESVCELAHLECTSSLFRS